jgi:hypothetical protein
MGTWAGVMTGYKWDVEYGCPDDPEDDKVLRSYSPLHNIEGTRKHPAFFISTGMNHVLSVVAGRPSYVEYVLRCTISTLSVACVVFKAIWPLIWQYVRK